MPRVSLTCPLVAHAPGGGGQFENLRRHKAAFVDCELVSIMVEAVQEAVGFTGSARSEGHNLTIELVLAIVRNLLAIPDNGPGGASSSSRVFRRVYDHTPPPPPPRPLALTCLRQRVG